VAAEDHHEDFYDPPSSADYEDGTGNTEPKRKHRQMTYPHDDRGAPRDNRNGSRNDPRNDPRDQQRGRDDRGDSRNNGNPRDGRNDNAPARALIPEGDYRVKCVAAKIGWAGTNSEQIGLRLKITEGQHEGTMLTYYGFFSDKTEEHTMKAMRALGFAGDDVSNLSSMYNDEAIAVVIHEADSGPNGTGEMRARVRWINGSDVSMSKVMNTSELASFANRMRGRFSRTAGGGGSKPNDRGNDRPPPRDDRRGGPADDRRPPPRDNRDDRQPPPRDDRDAPRQQGRFQDDNNRSGAGPGWNPNPGRNDGNNRPPDDDIPF
jgi:hypothetical protein